MLGSGHRVGQRRLNQDPGLAVQSTRSAGLHTSQQMQTVHLGGNCTRELPFTPAAVSPMPIWEGTQRTKEDRHKRAHTEPRKADMGGHTRYHQSLGGPPLLGRTWGGLKVT